MNLYFLFTKNPTDFFFLLIVLMNNIIFNNKTQSRYIIWVGEELLIN